MWPTVTTVRPAGTYRSSRRIHSSCALVEPAVVARVVHADGVEHEEVDLAAVERGVARTLPLLVEGLAVAGLADGRVAPAAVDAQHVVVADYGPAGHARCPRHHGVVPRAP